MMKYSTRKLKNGLTVIIQPDNSTPMATFSLLYGVGSRDEDPNKTGIAHFFEHLMFSGSKNVESFDHAVQMAGGESNAFTSNDVTNYYITLPADNIETAFWVESDRMLNPVLTHEKLEVQRKVVIEEFKQRFLNQPYGDVNLYLLPLAYQTHPYRWPTIGSDASHIENMTYQEAQDFFNQYYQPQNAYLCVSGPVETNEMFAMAEKWFAQIPSTEMPFRQYPQEKSQEEPRFLTLERDVPSDAIFISYPMYSRLDPKYYAADLLSDILSSGKSSRLFRNLTLNNPLFTDIQAVITGSNDPGLFLISGRIDPKIELEEAEQAIYEQLEMVANGDFSEQELQKVQNKAAANIAYSQMNALNNALSLCNAAFLGDLTLIDKEESLYLQVTKEDILAVAKEIFNPQKRSVIYYKSKK
ncbi:MAG: pitrilysin family protein [Salinivirgaceae bacterium]|nr:pitrilysin family protein [Salinivirgaceae bacterium]MDD4746640.1 pitrilysin family protein [Salinivirgaceae bacterium]MDY0279773.1 pitrilysin family protein [Salinivirgaceae bacterium]